MPGQVLAPWANDTRQLPPSATTRYWPYVSHRYQFKRGDPVIIVSGRYEGHTGVVDSAVFQQTVDFLAIFALATTWFWKTSEWLRCGGTRYQASRLTRRSGRCHSATMRRIDLVLSLAKD